MMSASATVSINEMQHYQTTRQQKIMHYLRPTTADINLDNFAFNIDQIRSKISKNKKILIAVKANAYGHGMIEISRFAQDHLDIDTLGVALVSEGIVLREAGIDLPILVFGGLLETDIPYLFEHRLTPTLIDFGLAEKISQFGQNNEKSIPVHVNIDTGMGRIGVDHQSAFDIIKKINQLPSINIEGLYTHFPSSDETDKEFTRQQIDRFKEIIKDLKSEGIHIPLTHCFNSGAIIDLDDADFNMVRPGIMIYGLFPSDEVDQNFPLKQVMTLRSAIVFKKQVQSGQTISYGRSYSPQKSTVIATVPIGYGDGFNRQFSNQGHVLVQGVRVPIVGRVTMDQIMIDLGDHPNLDSIQIGEEVVLYGWQEDQFISINGVADSLNTISYEVTCWINDRVPRRFYYQGHQLY